MCVCGQVNSSYFVFCVRVRVRVRVRVCVLNGITQTCGMSSQCSLVWGISCYNLYFLKGGIEITQTGEHTPRSEFSLIYEAIIGYLITALPYLAK